MAADLNELLRHLMEQDGSDLHVKAGAPPHIRCDGRLQPTTLPPIPPAEIEGMAKSILPPRRAAEFEEIGEADFALGMAGMGRFRVNVYRQRGTVGLAIRRVAPGVPSLRQLGLHTSVQRLAEEPRGLVIVSGPASSGKTTTVSAMIDHINEHRVANIVTIEDPIEVLHSDKRSIVSQREVGSDTQNYTEAMRRVLRQDPDVIFVDELRDAETAAAALAAAEAERLVISTLRTLSAAEGIARVVEFFEPAQQKQARFALASVLRGIVNQRLLERADGKGRIPAVEVMISTPRVAEHILVPDASGGGLERTIADGEYHGMQTLDQSLMALARDGHVSMGEALAVANDPMELRIALQTAGVGSY